MSEIVWDSQQSNTDKSGITWDSQKSNNITWDSKPQEVLAAPKQSSTVLEDVQEAGKQFVKKTIGTSSMAAAGILKLMPGDNSEMQDRIFQNMEDAQSYIDNISGGAAGKEQGWGGKSITGVLANADLMAGMQNAAPAAIIRAFTQPYGNTAAEVTKRTGDASAGFGVATAEAVVNALMVGLPAGKTPLKAIVINAATNMPAGIVSRAAIQQYLKDKGYDDFAKEYDPLEVNQIIADGIVGGVFGAAGAKYEKQPTTKKNAALEQEAIDFVNSQRKPSEPGISKATSDPAAGIDASEMKLPYMTAHKADIVNRYNEMLQARGEETIAGDRQLDNVIKNEREYNKPYWPDQELQDAIGSANKRANAIDNLPAAAEVKTPFTDIQSPYMSKEQLIKAQDQVDKTGEPSHSYMEIPEEMGTPPFWPDEALEKAKVSANRTATRRTGGPVDISRDGGGMSVDEATRPSLNDPNRIRDLQTNAKFANEIGKVSTLKDALNVVNKYLKDPDQLKVLQVLRQYADDDTGFRLYNPEEVNAAPEGAGVRALGENALGLHLVDDQGNTRVAVRGVNYFLDLKQNHGITSEVIMHEAGHNVTDRAFYIAADDKLRTLPKYRAHIQYALDMHNLRQAVEEQMTLEQRNEWRNALQNTAEFNAYGWTSPEFREFLKSIELPQQATTAWGKFKEFVTSFFGSKPKTKNAKDSIDAFLDRLDEIQEVSKQDYGDAITRLNAPAVRESRKTDRLKLTDPAEIAFIESYEDVITKLDPKIWQDVLTKKLSVNDVAHIILTKIARKDVFTNIININTFKKQLDYFAKAGREGAMVPEDVHEIALRYNRNPNMVKQMVEAREAAIQSHLKTRAEKIINNPTNVTPVRGVLALLARYKQIKQNPLMDFSDTIGTIEYANQINNVFSFIEKNNLPYTEYYMAIQKMVDQTRADAEYRKTDLGTWYRTNNNDIIQSLAHSNWCISRGYAPNYTNQGHWFDIFVPKDQREGTIAVVHDGNGNNIVEVQDSANNKTLSPESNAIFKEAFPHFKDVAQRPENEIANGDFVEQAQQDELKHPGPYFNGAFDETNIWQSTYKTKTNAFTKQLLDSINKIAQGNFDAVDVAKLFNSHFAVKDDGTLLALNLDNENLSFESGFTNNIRTFIHTRLYHPNYSKNRFSNKLVKNAINQLLDKVENNIRPLVTSATRLNLMFIDEYSGHVVLSPESVGILYDFSKYPNLKEIYYLNPYFDYMDSRSITSKQITEIIDILNEVTSKYEISTVKYLNNEYPTRLRKFIENLPVKYKNHDNVQLGKNLIPTTRIKYEGGWITLPKIRLPEFGKPSPDDIDTAAKAIRAANNQDISEWKALVPMTVNQKALYLKSPIVKFVYDHFRTINAEADVRFNQYKTYLKDVEDLIENKRNDALEMFHVLAKIQDPELKERRQVSEVANTREDFLREHGMPEHLVEPAIKVLNVLDAVGTFDQKVAEKAFGHNWRMEPMYFPREHTGAFTVAVMDADGKMQYMRGFDNGLMANQAKASLERQLEGRGYTIELTRNSANSLLDTLAAFDIYNYEMPEFLKGITDNMIKEIEVAKRKFEMERAGHNIAGYTGEVVYGDKAKTIGEKLSDDKLLSLLQRRLEQSFQLETKARVIKDIKEPLLDDPTALANTPNTAALIRLMVNRELGISINALEPIAKRADATVEMVGKQIDKIAGAMMGYKGGEVSAFKSREIARFVQAYTGVMSLFKLGLAPSVLLANTTTMLTTPVDGLRTAFNRGINPAIASLATLKSMVSHLDKDAMQWMKQADLEGMVEARISDPLQLTTNTHMRLNFERKVNTVRDIIEKGTNYSTLLYYYNFYKMAYPNLNPYSRQFKNLVYESTRSWTGDYTNQAQMLAIDMMGDVGRLHSNFAKWKWNQWGRLMNDLQDMKSGNIGPFAVTMLYTVAMAGAFGAPIVQEWEGLRRLGQKLGWWDIRPLAKVLYDLQDKMKDEFGDSAGRITNMLIHGPLSTASDEAFQAMGMTSGPDISGNLRFSSLTDVNTLPFSFAADLYAFGNSSVKQIGGILGLGPGAQFQEIKDGLKGTPTVVQNVLEEMYKNRDQTGSVFKQGMVEQFANQDKGLERLAPEEKAMAYLGLRSKRLNENVNRVYNKEWVERYEKKQFSKYTNLLVQNVNNPKQFDSVAQDIFELKGPKGIEEAIQKMIEIRKNRDTSYFEREAMGLMNNQDPIAVSKAIERLRNFRPSK